MTQGGKVGRARRAAPRVRCAGAGALLLACLLTAPAARAADLARLTANVTALASSGSRIPGYPGNAAAADLVEAALRQAGVQQVVREPFSVVAPVDHGAVLELAGDTTRIELQSLWPNLVRTNTTGADGIEGELFYAGQGAHADFNGHPMQDALVLMEFNTWANWLDAAALGARAILFIAPEETTIFEARQKWNWAPLNVPRFWVERQQGLALKERLAGAGAPARVRARMDWEQHQTWNIWGLVPGTDRVLRQEMWAVQAYYDGISVAPAAAPAAESACGIAGFIELANYLEEHPPARTVAFIATGAHFLGQTGLRQFFALHARRRPEFRRRMAQRFVADSLNVDLLLAEMQRRRMSADSLGVYLSANSLTGRPALDSVNVDTLVARLKLMGVLDTPDTIGVHLEPDSLAFGLFVSLDLSSQSDQLGVWHNTYNTAFRRFYKIV